MKISGWPRCLPVAARLVASACLSLAAMVAAASEPPSAEAVDDALADALRAGMSNWSESDGEHARAVRALVETGRVGRAVVADLAGSGTAPQRRLAASLLAWGDDVEGGWDALHLHEVLRPAAPAHPVDLHEAGRPRGDPPFLERLELVEAQRRDLRARLADPDVTRRLDAAWFLAEMGDGAALPVLLASARVAADDGPAAAAHVVALDVLPWLTMVSGPDRSDPGVGAREAARWWVDWGERNPHHDLVAVHRAALREALDASRTKRRRARSKRSPMTRMPPTALPAPDPCTALDLLLEDVLVTYAADYDLPVLIGLSACPEPAIQQLERIAADPAHTVPTRREALRIVVELDPEHARSMVVSLLRSDDPADRETAWADVARRLAPEDVRGVALEALAGDAPDRHELYRSLADTARPEDCEELLRRVTLETQEPVQIAGWAVLSKLPCASARAAMRSRLADASLGPRLAGMLAAQGDPSFVRDVSRRCGESQGLLHAMQALLRRTTVPGLAYGLRVEDPDLRLAAAIALREWALESARNEANPWRQGPDPAWAELSHPSVRGALARAAARTGDPAAAWAQEALTVLEGEGLSAGAASEGAASSPRR